MRELSSINEVCGSTGCKLGSLLCGLLNILKKNMIKQRLKLDRQISRGAFNVRDMSRHGFLNKLVVRFGLQVNKKKKEK